MKEQIYSYVQANVRHKGIFSFEKISKYVISVNRNTFLGVQSKPKEELEEVILHLDWISQRYERHAYILIRLTQKSTTLWGGIYVAAGVNLGLQYKYIKDTFVRGLADVRGGYYQSKALDNCFQLLSRQTLKE